MSIIQELLTKPYFTFSLILNSKMNTLCLSLDPKVSRGEKKGNTCLMRIYNRVDIRIYSMLSPRLVRNGEMYLHMLILKSCLKILFKT